MLFQSSENPRAQVSFTFERGRFVAAQATMEGPTEAPLSFLEKDYGPPSAKLEKNDGWLWNFADGGSVYAGQHRKPSGVFQILVIVSAK